jgi:hypothetical protein
LFTLKQENEARWVTLHFIEIMFFFKKSQVGLLTVFKKTYCMMKCNWEKRERKTKQNNKHRIINPCTWKEKKMVISFGNKEGVCVVGGGGKLLRKFHLEDMAQNELKPTGLG